jgi:tetratricopeptide (TPR) repeat protein
MKKIYHFAVIILCSANLSFAQNDNLSSRINLMFFKGEYEKIIDTCNLILSADSLNANLYYVMGLAYLNSLDEDRCLYCFSKAYRLNPDNKLYTFSLAKEYYNTGQVGPAKPLLDKLCSTDSLNWIYAYYLSSIYMQLNKFDNAISIYRRFLMQEPTNHIYIDKLAFANLKKGNMQIATDLYKTSLAINNKNVTAIKNLSYLYALTGKPDTAIQILSKGIVIDPTDIDLYVRRAQLYYLKNYTKRALDDYLVVLASGDSSKLYLKRAGIGYSYNLQPQKAIPYLLLAYKADSSDYETCSFLGQCYNKVDNFLLSVYYYNRAIKILTPVEKQLSLTYGLKGDSYYYMNDYQNALTNYLKAQTRYPDPNNYMKIANIYDDKLDDKKNSIINYQLFLDNLKDAKMTYTSDYIESIRKRLNYLKEEISKGK